MKIMIHQLEMFYILRGFGYGEALRDNRNLYNINKLTEIATSVYDFRYMVESDSKDIYFFDGSFSDLPVRNTGTMTDYDLLNLFLEDDDTETGGVAHSEERLADFVEEILYEDEDGIMTMINQKLKECGIKPIDPSKI